MITDNHSEERRTLSLEDFRRQLSNKKGKAYWRSLEELANSEAFEQIVRQEYPRQGSLLDSLNRRDFLKILGASLALAGLTACTPQANEKILPYTQPPEQVVPGKSNYYASAMVQDGYAKGVLIETSMGRPIKVEGNPQHPDSLGATDIFMQASLLDLYDPDRARQVTNDGAAKTWADFTAALGSILNGLGDGNGLRILTGPVSSPTLIAQFDALLERYPQAAWYQYSPVGNGNAVTAATQAFGEALQPVYDFEKADVILSLECDFLLTEPGHLNYSRAFAQRHQPISATGTMNRLYVVESAMSLTGSNADHRLAVKPSQVEAFARAVASRLGVEAGTAAGEVPGQGWLDPLVADLQRAGAGALVLAGERQPPVVHALAYAMNQALGAIGNTVTFIPSPVANPVDPNAALHALVDDLNTGGVELLVILDGNPAYSAPADLDFSAAMQKAAQRVYLAPYADETAQLATWSIPAAHYMEMWGDARAFDGTASIIQPVIEPLYGGKSPYEVLAALLGQPDAKGYDILRQYWQDQWQDGSFENGWRDALSKGVLPGAAPAAVAPAQVSASALSAASPAPQGELEIVFRADDTIWDGRFANNAWLQELPKPLTKLTWDNAAFINPATAERLGVATNDLVKLSLRGRSVDAPVFVEPGQPDNVVTVTLGYGRKAGGNLLLGAGFNAYTIRTTQAPWFDSGLEVTRTGGTYKLAATYEHWTMENRDLVRAATLEEYEAHPNFAQEEHGGIDPNASLYEEKEYNGYSWGMSINLNTCIGCNACVVACQSENNIPTVGKDQVARGREMLWLRVDRYYEGSIQDPKVVYQPVPCMHCDNAPCESVCPVEATSHSTEGINEMTYNRCVGTRYCANNCPYKVRRFNYYKYVDENIVPLQAMRNPDVTVRSRGVMEKCTFCVQRINQARIQAEVEGRQIQDGEVKTACQQACPTNAIVFGNINQTDSTVRQLKDSPLNYGLLAELGTRPRTTYLAKVKNPNPMIQEGAEG